MDKVSFGLLLLKKKGFSNTIMYNLPRCMLPFSLLLGIDWIAVETKGKEHKNDEDRGKGRGGWID